MYDSGVPKRLAHVSDYDIETAQSCDRRFGRKELGRLDRPRAAVRLLEYAPYREIIRILGYGELVPHWPERRPGTRSAGRRPGSDFLAERIPPHHPELI